MWWILAFSLTLQSAMPADLPQCWAAARGLAELVKESFRDTLQQQRSSLLPHDNTSASLPDRIAAPAMQDLLFNLNRPPSRHYLIFKQLGMAAFLEDDHLQAGIFHAWAFKAYQAQGYSDEVHDHAYAAALSLYVVYDETKNERIGRLAAEFFVKAGFLETAAKIYDALEDPRQAEQIRRQIPDRLEISGTQPRPSANHGRNGLARPQRVLNADILSAFQTLGLSPSASAEEIRARFRERIKILHPAASGENYSEGLLIQTIEAKETLAKYSYI